MYFRTLISMLFLCQLFIYYPSPVKSNDGFFTGKEEVYDNIQPKFLSAINLPVHNQMFGFKGTIKDDLAESNDSYVIEDITDAIDIFADLSFKLYDDNVNYYKLYHLNKNGKLQEYSDNLTFNDEECKGTFPTYKRKHFVRACIDNNDSLKSFKVSDKAGNLIIYKNLPNPLYNWNIDYYDNDILIVEGYKCKHLDLCPPDSHVKYIEKDGVPLNNIDVTNLILSDNGKYLADRLLDGNANLTSIVMYNHFQTMLYEKHFQPPLMNYKISFSNTGEIFLLRVISKYDDLGEQLETIYFYDSSSGDLIGHIENKYVGNIIFSENDKYIVHIENHHTTNETTIYFYKSNKLHNISILKMPANYLDVQCFITDEGSLSLCKAKLGENAFLSKPIVFLIKNGRKIWYKEFNDILIDSLWSDITNLKVSTNGKYMGFLLHSKSNVDSKTFSKLLLYEVGVK